MSGIARGRLSQERKHWRRDKPFGMHARPQSKADGSTDLLIWDCIIPGKKATTWDGAFLPLTLRFSEEYPEKPPTAHFPQGFFHPNVYPSGKVCLSILNEEKGWRPSLSLKQILQGVQDLLDNPNNADPAQEGAYRMLSNSKAAYIETVKKEVAKYQQSFFE